MQNLLNDRETAPVRTPPKVTSYIARWTCRTRPIVRLDVMNRMVTKGYRKGVYERVTKGTGVVQRSAGILPVVPEPALSLSQGRPRPRRYFCGSPVL